MKKEQLERLERAHMARRQMYNCAAPSVGQTRALMKEARRRLLRTSAPKLGVVTGGSSDGE